MLAWLWDLIVGKFCNHKWVLTHRNPVYSPDDLRLPHSMNYVQTCEKCMTMKKFNL